MSESIRLTAPAKINLNLFIIGRRADGYHELDTLFLKLAAPADTLTLTPLAPGAGLELHCEIPGLPPEKNILSKAWRAFGLAAQFRPEERPGLRVEVEKRIPQGMGLGGGSADAGTLLRRLNAEAGARALSPEALNALGASLGADVPLFLLDAPAARARGIGERLRPASPDLSDLFLLLACPRVHVDTAWAYAEWDRHPQTRSILTTATRDTTSSGPESGPVLHNDFEGVVFRAFPQLRKLKEILLAEGAAGAAMSGSGAGIFAFFRRKRAVKRAASRLEAEGVPSYIQAY